MKIYRNLPNRIVNKSREYKLDAGLSAMNKKPLNKRYRIIKVLPKSLEGMTDLHGRPYKPSEFVFVETGTIVFNRRKLKELLNH